MENNSLPLQLENKNFFIKLMKGGFPLVVTYWFFYFLIGFVLNILLFSWAEFSELESRWNIILYIVTCIACIAYGIISCIAVWNSANNYKGRKLWSTLAKTAVILGIIKTFSGIQSSFFPSQSQAVQQFKDEIISYNRSLPEMVDNETELSSVMFKEDNLMYVLRLINFQNNEINVPNFSEKMKLQLKKSVCENKEISEFFDFGRKIIYLYRDKNNNYIESVIIQKSDCIN